MATLIAKVRQVTGSIVADVPDDLILEALGDSQGFVLASLPLDILQTAFRGQTSTVNDNSGIDITGEVVLGAERNGREADIKQLQGFYATESAVDSIYKPTKLFPFAFIKDNKIFIKPDPEAGELGICAIAKDIVLSLSSTFFLGKYESIGLNYACYVDYMHQFAIYAAKAEADILKVSGASGYLNDFVSALPTYNPIAEPILPTAPTISIAYVKPTSALPSGIEMDTVLPVLVLPSTPTLPQAPNIAIQYLAPAGYTFDKSITMTKTLPTVSMPSAPSIPVAPVTGSTYVAPTGYTLPDAISLAQSLPAVANPALPTIDFTEFTDAITNAKLLIDTGLTNEGSLAHSAGYWLNDEDPEMVQSTNQTAGQEITRAGAELNKQKTLLEKFSVSLESETKRVGAEIQKYQADVQKEVQRVDSLLKNYSAEQKDASSTLQASIEGDRNAISVYGTEVQSLLNQYKTEVEAESTRVQTDVANYNAELQKLVQDVDTNLKAYSAEQKDSSAELQASIETSRQEIAKYGTETKALLDEFSTNVKTEVERVGFEIQKYSTELQKKMADADIMFKAHAAEQNDASADLQAEIETARADTSIYGAEVSAKIQEYSALVQAEDSRFGGGLAKARSYIEAAQTLQVSISSSLGLAQQFSQNGVAMFKVARESLDSVINNSRGQVAQ